MQKSDLENLQACRRKLRTAEQELSKAKALLKKLVDCGDWSPTSFKISPWGKNPPTGQELEAEIQALVGVKNA